MKRNNILQDIQGVLRGLYAIQQSANTLQNQRSIPIQRFVRQLTDQQRQSYLQQKQEKEFLQELQKQEQIAENQIQKESQILQQKNIQTNINVQKEEKIQEDTIKIQQKKEYKVDSTIGNKLYQESIQKKEAQVIQKINEQKTESEIGESSFGKSEHQKEQTYSSDTPFFMRQDRPKFTTQERYVPSSAASRAMHFGMLGIQLVGGTVAEAVKQKIGFSNPDAQQNFQGVAKYALNEKNANRLANNFKKMRGGALKIGQILSTSEQSILPPIIREAMEKARSEADIMPLKQVTKNLIREYGSDWQNNFREINLYPFAAASIGQVHEAILKDGLRVAIKMQYTGISSSIDSDLNNFKRIIDLLGVFPRGLYLNEAIDVARNELHWECNYEREALYQRAYRNHVSNYPSDFYVPKVIDNLSSKTILCSEFVNGREIDTFMGKGGTQEQRNRIGELMIKLCFKELFEFKMMQTDPNPANYLFDTKQNLINLLDLGAGRDFEDDFLDSYLQIIWGAFNDDRDQIIYHSQKIGFLTGEENKEMINAHYKGTMIIGEPFRTKNNQLYDFGCQGLTEKVSKILPTLSKHRLSPPPQEVYSLHKKIIGTYLMCIKLNSQVPAREILEHTFNQWQNKKQINQQIIKN